MASRKITEVPLDQACSRYFHRSTERHILVLEADLPNDLKEELIQMSENGRCFSNYLRHIFIGRIRRIFRTRKYRSLRAKYHTLKDSKKRKDKKELKKISKELFALYAEYHLTEKDVAEEQKKIYRRFGLPSVFAVTLAADVWFGIRKVLFNEGKELHYLPKNRLVSLRAKSIMLPYR